MAFKNLISRKKEDKLKVDIKVTYNIGSKREIKTFKAYALLGKWLVLNYKKIRIVNIEFNGNY